MYKIYKRVLESKAFNLSDITEKIEQRCAEGALTDAEREELITLANQNADASMSEAPVKEQIKALFENHGEIGQAIIDLIGRVEKLEGKQLEETPEEPEEYPEWQKWNGIGLIPYKTGSKVTHNGVKYISQVDNNIWEPGAPGVYENIWKVVEETE
jgi:hypothetical protein